MHAAEGTYATGRVGHKAWLQIKWNGLILLNIEANMCLVHLDEKPHVAGKDERDGREIFSPSTGLKQKSANIYIAL